MSDIDNDENLKRNECINFNHKKNGDKNWFNDLNEALGENADTLDEQDLLNTNFYKTWEDLLQVNSTDSLENFNELFDLPNQCKLHEDCQLLVDKLGNDEGDKVFVLSDIESVLTHFCKTRNYVYTEDNGWLSILQTLVALKLRTKDLYIYFSAICDTFLSRHWVSNESLAFSTFRLVLLYHDPELCSFLDTKKVSPDLYAHSWFCSLFAATCKLSVTLAIWNAYFKAQNPFLLFFMALVILVNARDKILSLKEIEKEKLASIINDIPSALEFDDIQDFMSLSRHYLSETPSSFNKVNLIIMHIISQIFNFIYTDTEVMDHIDIKNMLSLPVAATELLQSTGSLRYFIIDCRPAEQYNAGHFTTAFHLDATLMLQEPAAFSTAVEALFTAKKQALALSSDAAGEHLCFMSSGYNKEDQLVNMVISLFLQKFCKYVSFVLDGYAALHELVSNDNWDGIVDHDYKNCLYCNKKGNHPLESLKIFPIPTNSIIQDTLNVMKTKSALICTKLVNLVSSNSLTISNAYSDQHVNKKDRSGNRYRGATNVFSINDENNCDSMEEQNQHDIISLDIWLKKPDVIAFFECYIFSASKSCHEGYDFSFMLHYYSIFSYLLITHSHLYLLRVLPDKKDMASIVARRWLASIMRITSRKRYPELITFRYGSSAKEVVYSDVDRLIIPKAGDATKLIKQQIVKISDK